jgi:hypothetical protein
MYSSPNMDPEDLGNMLFEQPTYPRLRLILSWLIILLMFLLAVLAGGTGK